MTKLTNAADAKAFFDAEKVKHAIANHNKQNAVDLARAGIAITVCDPDDKTPLPKLWTELDTDISEERKKKIAADFEDEWGFPPFYIGATRNTETIRKWFRANPKLTPAIVCGLSGVHCIDNDIKERDGVLKNGVELFDAFCQPHGGLPDGAFVVNTQGGGRHLYFAGDKELGCSAGSLKKGCETDSKGSGGYVIAPGTIRANDGKRYGSKADLKAFIKAFTSKSFVPVPQFIRDALGKKPEAATVTAEELKQPLADLDEKEWADYSDTFGDAALGARFDIEVLKRKDPEFADVMESPSGNCSDDRWKISRRLSYAFPDMTVVELATFYQEHADIAGELTDDGKGQGKYNRTDIAKEWSKNRKAVEAGEVKSPSSTGDAMGAVDENEPASYVRDSFVVANYQPIRWLVKRLIPLNSVGALYGLPNVGKSFVVFDLANHARRGRDWFGRKVKGGDVLYLYAEGAEGIAGRAKAWAISNDASGGNVALMNGVPNLFSDKGAPAKIIAAARACSTESGQPVRLIIVDTLAAATTGADGSSDRDMGLVCDRLRKVANELECAVLVVHHSGKDVSKGMRGSSAILGAVDYSLLVDETKGVSTLIVEKMRDARKGQAIKFKLVEVVLGVDEDGDDVTSCIVRPVNVGGALSAVDGDEEVPVIKVPDRREDRVAMLLAVARDEAQRAAAEDEPLEEIGLTVPALVEAVNAKRGELCGLDGVPLLPLNRKAVWRVVETAVEAGQMGARRSKVFLAA